MTRRILWAVDPFGDDTGFLKHFLESFRPIVLAMKAEVEPIYVLSQEQLNLSSDILIPSMERYQLAAEKALAQMLKEVELPGLTAPTVLSQNSSTTSGQAAHLLEAHALASGADLIAVATHAKTGLRRFFLGSFAESLLLHSRVAVLSINPQSKPVHAPVHVLFPTDFSDRSYAAFRDALLLTRNFGGKLSIYHYLPSPIEPVIQSGAYLLGGGWMDLPTYVATQTDEQKRRAETWLRTAKESDVNAELVIESGKGGILDAILTYAEKRGTSLIAMTAQSGTLATVLIGSVARQVARNASCAVWIHRSSEKT